MLLFWFQWLQQWTRKPKETSKIDQYHEVNHLNKTNQVFQANPVGCFNLTLLGQHTDSSSSEESDHRSATFSNHANTSDISSILETTDEQSQQTICNVKLHMELGLLWGAKLVPTISYMERLPALMLTLGSTLSIWPEWQYWPITLHEDELEKNISKSAVGIGGIAFAPYNEMPVTS